MTTEHDAPSRPVIGSASRILVTGAAGFIGSHLAERLARSGSAVIAIDNFDNYYSKSIKDQNVRIVESVGADFRECDIRNFGDLASLIDVTRPDLVFHLAAKAGVRNSVKFPRQYFETNLLGTQNVLDACRSLGVDRLVMASTSSVYGETKDIPFQESDPAVNPLHPYAASKRASELLAQTYSQLYDLRVSVARLFTVYGPRGRPDMMPRQLLESVSNGREVPLFEGDFYRDWTYVDDIVDGLILLGENPTDFGLFNIGAGDPHSLADFIAEVEAQLRGPANLVPTPAPKSEMSTTFADISRARESFGYAPRVEMKDGVRRMCEWWESGRQSDG